MAAGAGSWELTPSSVNWAESELGMALCGFENLNALLRWCTSSSKTIPPKPTQTVLPTTTWVYMGCLIQTITNVCNENCIKHWWKRVKEMQKVRRHYMLMVRVNKYCWKVHTTVINEIICHRLMCLNTESPAGNTVWRCGLPGGSISLRVNFESVWSILPAVGSLCFVLVAMVKDMFVVKNESSQHPALATMTASCWTSQS